MEVIVFSSAGFRRLIVIVLFVSGLAIAHGAKAQDNAPPKQKTHPLVPALQQAKAAGKAAEALTDFQAVFSKREVVRGRLQPPQTMRIKLRRKPFSVYLHFIKPHEGREVIYVDGRNRGHILAHETGLKSVVGTVSLPPTSPRALEESKYPITEIGLRTMVQTVIAQWERETKYGEINVQYYPNARLGNTLCRVIESTHPRPRKQFPYYMTRLYIDKKSGLPVRVEQYGFPRRAGERPPLMEEYTYSAIKTNVGLKDIDFDTRNPKYGF
jgi:hypothetical protein